ncbi:MAG TPA: hypothetical protein ENK02_15640 [Planctomycetes bacterium]|nr:hypothetical protein [Planctomycetota bacterium]
MAFDAGTPRSKSLPKGPIPQNATSLQAGGKQAFTRIGMGAFCRETRRSKSAEAYCSLWFRGENHDKTSTLLLRSSAGGPSGEDPLCVEHWISTKTPCTGRLVLRAASFGPKGLTGDFKILLQSGEWSYVLNWNPKKRLTLKEFKNFSLTSTGLRIRFLGYAKMSAQGKGVWMSRLRLSVRFTATKARG